MVVVVGFNSQVVTFSGGSEKRAARAGGGGLVQGGVGLPKAPNEP